MEAENELQRKQFERMTTEPVGKLLFMLSVPTIISMMVSNIYNLVDTAFVGALGTSESGATGIVFGYMAILSFLFMKPLLYLLGSTKTIAPYAGTYIFYILLSAPISLPV